VIGLRVARVGDGACAAVYTGAGRRLAAIIDCGSTQGGQEAADGLARIVDLPVRRPITIVVTHLHVDHYSGLIHLASRPRSARFFGIDLVQAALPRLPQLESITARLFALELVTGAVTGLPDLDLAAILGRVTRFGVNARWVSRGDQIHAQGHQFDVLWPPAFLDASLSTKVERAVASFDDLAAVNDEFARALHTVRSGVPVALQDIVRETDQRLDHGSLRDDFDYEYDLGAYPSEDFPDGVSTLHAYDESESTFVQGLDARHRPLFDHAVRAFRSAANDMSLVVATPSRDFVAWGDAPLRVVRQVQRREVPLGPGVFRPRLSLAPHHGSQGPNSALGQPSVCISSGGARMYPHWVSNHLGCPARFCLNTHVDGDLLFSS
jgi:hypothetical protein